jgi:DNA-directed RNA polymerase I, II, and III subunit RPABC2
MEEADIYNDDTFEEVEDIIDEPLDEDDLEIDGTSELYNIETSDIGEVKLRELKLKKEEDESEEEDEDEDEEEEDEEENIERFGLKRNKLFEESDIYENKSETALEIVKPEDRMTSEYMTIYEYAMVIGTRATHISKGAPIFTTIDTIDDPIQIAKKEINESKCPLNITRRLRNSNKIEMWSVNDMIKPYNI